MAMDDEIRALAAAIGADMKLRAPSVALTQAQFDALPGGPVAGTLYYIVPAA